MSRPSLSVLSADAGETGGERQVAALLIGVGAENRNNRSMEADASDYFIYSLRCFLFIRAIRASFRKFGNFRKAVEQKSWPRPGPTLQVMGEAAVQTGPRWACD